MFIVPFDALLIALATYRLTRLVTRDHLTKWFRERVLEPTLRDSEPHEARRRIPDPGPPGYTHERYWHEPSRLDRLAGWLAFLVSCPACLSVWISAALCGAYATWPDPTRPLTLILAASAVAVLLLDRDRS